MWWIWIVVAVIVVLLLFVILTYNGLIQVNNKVKEAFATMDVYLKKRWDLIPNVIESVKGYASHEQATLEKVIELRNGSYDAMSSDEKIKANEKLSQGIKSIFALAESYPDLKASENFKDLSAQLARVEEDIANSRKYYNGAVRLFNNKVQMFPGNIVAGLFGFKEKDMFETAAEERENVSVNF